MSIIPEENIKHAKCGNDYLDISKKFVVNMTSNKKRLHIKNTKCCYSSKFMYDYIDFDSEEDAYNFFKEYDKDIIRCNNCFKKIR